ncbi:MAG: acyl-CoA dehydrogenase family protein [Firmicutes bacterium]|jgi:alkylation response protein AidB-like acyl-CoA dehydrogenase|nr:acyl-CoA dehydrogenase family protein [Bacillota bacterium]
MIFDAKHEMIRKLVRQFAETELTTEVLDRVEETGEFPEEIVEKMAKCGFLGLKIPREYGGAGADTLAYVIMIEEIARVSAVASLYANTPNSLGGGPLMQAGTKEQLEKYLVPAVQNKIKIVFALTEPGAGSDAGSMVTTATKDGDYYVLNGRKCFISGAPIADYCIVYAKTDMTKGNKGISAFVVDMKAPGISCGKHEAKMGIVGYPTSDVVLEDVRVHKSDMLGKENMGFINAMKTLDGGRLGVSAQSIGVAQGCLDEAIKYSKERVQFGKPICKNQAIAFMIADMATKLTAAKELVYLAAQMKDKNDPKASMYCSMAKYYASETCNEIAAKAVQIHGGYGFIKEYPVERKYRDCRVFTIYEGTSQVQQMVISGNLLK